MVVGVHYLVGDPGVIADAIRSYEGGMIRWVIAYTIRSFGLIGYCRSASQARSGLMQVQLLAAQHLRFHG